MAEKKKVMRRDFDTIAEYICDEHKRRKDNRKYLEKQWDEIDRQIRMEPDTSYKLNADGSVDKTKIWMPETELPLQAQTQEILVSDARRMTFPPAGTWFAPHVALTDDYLTKVEFSSLISGDVNDVPSRIDQDNADKLVLGVVDHWHNQYDFRGNVDQINGEAFKYGMGIGRARLTTKTTFNHTAKGTTRITQKIPVLFPRSIKNTYLDDSKHFLMNEGHIIGPSVISEWNQKVEDIRTAANKGNTDPNKDGWIPSAVKNIEGNKAGEVKLLEFEGDMVVPRKAGRSLFIPNVIITVIVGENSGKTVQRVIRTRFRQFPESSYIEFPYHAEHLDMVYPSSPLMKGRPLQIAAVDALNRLLMVGALNAQPPLKYNPDDTYFNTMGGPVAYPGANWPTTDGVTPEKIGDPATLLSVYAALVQQYADVTGVNASRLGAQTVSHTTAYAKEAEMSRSTIRTVDYVHATLSNSLTKWLDLEYKIGREAFSSETVYISPYNGFVDLQKKHLPEKVVFEVHGAGGPAEDQAKKANRLQALQMAMQISTMAAQMGQKSEFDLAKAQEQVLKEGGWTDIDALFTRQTEQPTAMEMGALPGMISQGPVQ